MNLYFRLLLLWVRARRRGAVDLWDTVATSFRVLPNDLDVFGHLTNSRYLTLMDIGRTDLMLRSGFWAKMKVQGWYPVVAGQTITYRKSLQPWQRFELRTRVVGFDDRWGYIEQSFCVGSTVYAQAFVRTRFLKKSGGSVEHDELEKLAGGFPESLRVPEWLQQWTTATRINDQRLPAIIHEDENLLGGARSPRRGRRMAFAGALGSVFDGHRSVLGKPPHGEASVPVLCQTSAWNL
jgi:acyl-CoA thioesterase FadM